MLFLKLLVFGLFYFAWPVIAIPTFNEKWKRRYSALILTNFILMYAIFYWASLVEGDPFIADIIIPIILSFVAYFYLKKTMPLESDSKSK